MREINPAPSYREAKRLERLQKRAKRYGYRLARSRWHQPFVHNRGGLVLLDSRNNIIAGDGYSLDLDLAEDALSKMINLSCSQVSASFLL
jgi:hypothetical protein